MKMKKWIIALPVILLTITLAIVAVVVILQNNDRVATEITADNLSVEFDGAAHSLEATANGDGSLFYEYVGVDNDYNSAAAPVQAGEYDVIITFKPFKKGSEITKNVKLYITLPYSVDETGTEISAYTGHQKEVVLPSTYRNKTIKSLGDNTFKDCNITSVKAPDMVFSINPKAFNDSLEKLIIHQNTKLLDGQYPNGLTLEFYGKPKRIFSDTFGDVEGVEEIKLPSSIKTIDQDSFSKIKASKLSLYSNAPLNGTGLSQTVKYVCVSGDATNTLADNFFEDCQYVERIEIDESINTFGTKCFYNCTSLNELILHSKIERVGSDCFNGEFVLKKLTLAMKKLTDSVGENLNQSGLLMIDTVELKECEEMGFCAFKDCAVIKKAILPDTLESLNTSAFEGCSNLSEVVLPKRLKSINAYAFQGCGNLSEIILPENLDSIGHYAFSGCTSLVTLTIPEMVTTILDGAFADCKKLKTINLPEGLTAICNAVFSGCNSLESIEMPDTVTSIEEYAFDGCNSLGNIKLSENLEKIADGAFGFCHNLSEITLPAKVKTFGIMAFIRCDKLTKLTILSTSMLEGESNIFADLPRNCVVFVHNELLAAYQERYSGVTFSAIE